MNTSDWFALAQVILAVVSVAVDILLAYVAYRVDVRSKDNHLNMIMSHQREEEPQQEEIQISPETGLIDPKIKTKIDRIFSKIHKEFPDGHIMAKNLVGKLDNLFTEKTVVQTLMKNNKVTIKWFGALSTETIIEIININGLRNSFYACPLK